MSAVIETAALRSAVRAASAVTERRSTIPILGCVRLRMDDDRLAITATDMDIRITTRAPVQGGGDLDVAVPAGRLSRMLAALDTEVIVLTGKGADLEFTAGETNGRFAGFPPEDTPIVSADFPTARTFSMPAGDLRGILASTLTAVSTEPGRHYLNGVYLHTRVTSDGARVLSGVATDGHKLSQQDAPLPPAASEAFPARAGAGYILPRKSAGILLRMLGPSPAGDVKVSIDPNGTNARFRLADGTDLISKFIDGAFPDYERVVPSNFTGNAKVGRRDLLSGLRRVAAMCEGKHRHVLLRFDGTRLGVMTKGEEGGHAYTAIPTVSTSHFEIVVNAAYLRTLLAASDAEVTVISYSDHVNPLLLQGEGEMSLRQVIMPVRL
ncbi:DNA polymerase III subunit beta (plasmid) [Azospirillum sp. HJ39]|uniref:DNA polymerase III subunit beta n=1 Tax=Azospirillum sp. HJ39 TaxID=3159496 RepID=UPI003557F159